MLCDVVSVRVMPAFRLELAFDDGRVGIVDIPSIVPFKGVFEPLGDPVYFARVVVDADTGTIRWPNGADLAPSCLYEAAAVAASGR